jgi:hypothetical protein
MSSIQEAAMKAAKDRKTSDLFKIKAGHMITFDTLSKQTEQAERKVLRKVVRKNINRFFGCMNLPLTLAYFLFYTFSALLHEDITMVFLMESEFRQRLEGAFESVSDINALWGYLGTEPDCDGDHCGEFLNMFFPTKDGFGQPLVSRGEKGDKWGNWGRVLTYNQVQAMIRFETSRTSTEAYGLPYLCPQPVNLPLAMCKAYTGPKTEETDVLEYLNEGFVKNDDAQESDPELIKQAICRDENQARFKPPWCAAFKKKGRYLAEDGSALEAKPRDTAQIVKNAKDRRLDQLIPTLRSSLPVASLEEGQRFRFWLYPTETQKITKERLEYFRARRWLDRDTKWLEIRLYLLNAEMGRPRLMETKLQFSFSPSGTVFFRVDFRTMMLKMFPNIASMACDGIWFLLLCITSMIYAVRLWKAFVKGAFLQSACNLPTIWEFFVLAAGWCCVYGFSQQSKLIKDLNGKLEELRELRWQSSQLDFFFKSKGLYDTAETVSYQLGNIQYLMAQYLLFLMFRFLVSFAVQPRLATVTTTLRAVLPDILHFLIVFMPTFLAYVISGNLVFGRRMPEFATIQASFATCFRIIMECEYDWDTLAAEYYWTTALWIWSFIVLIVLILLNMVLAIILDIYNDVRQASLSQEAVWTTMWNYAMRARLTHFWVPDRILEEHLAKVTRPMVTKDDLKEPFPDVPELQLKLLYEACAIDMGWEAKKFLDKSTSLKMSGAVKMTTDSVNTMVTNLTSEDDPLKAFTAVKKATKAQAKKKVAGDGLFLSAPPNLKGNRNPHVIDPKTMQRELDGVGPDSPDWLKELQATMTKQKRWMLYVNWQVENLQWQMQQTHMKNFFGDKQSMNDI